jgi:hypothetical protein
MIQFLSYSMVTRLVVFIIIIIFGLTNCRKEETIMVDKAKSIETIERQILKQPSQFTLKEALLLTGVVEDWTEGAEWEFGDDGGAESNLLVLTLCYSQKSVPNIDALILTIKVDPNDLGQERISSELVTSIEIILLKPNSSKFFIWVGKQYVEQE